MSAEAGPLHRIAAAGALLLAAAGVTAAANWWIKGPGTAPIVRDPVVEAAVLPEAELDRPLSFKNGANVTALLWGWCQPEPWGVWSFGRRATLGLRREPAGLSPPARLILRLHPYLAPPRLRSQRVTLRLGNAVLADAVLDQPEQTLTVPLDRVRWPEPTAPLLLTFDLPDAAPPNQVLGTGDYRVLGIGLESLTLAR